MLHAPVGQLVMLYSEEYGVVASGVVTTAHHPCSSPTRGSHGTD
jgi:hypothetical protein